MPYQIVCLMQLYTFTLWQLSKFTFTNIWGAGKKYIWTPNQEEIMLPLVKARSTAKVILRELEAQGAADRHGNFPTLLQLNTKKNYMFKTQVMAELSICDTADLRILIEERS